MKTENYILNSSEFIPHWFEDVHGTGERKLRRRKRIKQQTLIERKKQNQNIYLN